MNSIWVNPNKAWSAKVTSIDCASTATNIIPDKGKMILDIRAQDNETMNELLEKLKTVITNACACVNVTCEITFPGGVIPAAVYDEDLVDQVRKTIGEVLDTLTEREKRVIILRFGLIDGRQRTLEEVGQEFQVTRERIRQIETKALRKLRHPTRSKKLKDFLD